MNHDPSWTPNPNYVPAEEIRFSCPRCQRPMSGPSALLDESVSCPDCAFIFTPVAMKFEPTKTAGPALSEESRQRHELRQRIERVQRQAKSFSTLAIFCLLLAVVVWLITFFISLGPDGVNHPGGYWFGGVLIGAAMWLYVAAQIIHIRANTEK